MVEDPGVEVSASASSEFRVEGPLASRAEQFVLRFLASLGETQPPPLRLVVRKAAPAHVGLGTGTQLGLAVARVLAEWTGAVGRSAPELAGHVGRAERSAIGVYGFDHGGLLVDGGKRVRGRESAGPPMRPQGRPPAAPSGAMPEISPLLVRHPLPDAWRWILFIPRHGQGLHGAEERAAIERLTAQVDDRACADLCRHALLGLLPAAVEEDFDAFSDALYEFGRRAGDCFSAAQSGTYLNDEVADLVSQLRRSWVRGVGQTSWGPTLYALASDPDQATRIRRQFEDNLPPDRYDLVVTSTNTCGARVTIA